MCECAYYQNEDEPHPLPPHVINQVRQAGELRVQNEVQLTLHVVDVCVLHILQTTAFRDEFFKFRQGEYYLSVILSLSGLASDASVE